MLSQVLIAQGGVASAGIEGAQLAGLLDRSSSRWIIPLNPPNAGAV